MAELPKNNVFGLLGLFYSHNLDASETTALCSDKIVNNAINLSFGLKTPGGK